MSVHLVSKPYQASRQQMVFGEDVGTAPVGPYPFPCWRLNMNLSPEWAQSRESASWSNAHVSDQYKQDWEIHVDAGLDVSGRGRDWVSETTLTFSPVKMVAPGAQWKAISYHVPLHCNMWVVKYILTYSLIGHCVRDECGSHPFCSVDACILNVGLSDPNLSALSIKAHFHSTRKRTGLLWGRW